MSNLNIVFGSENVLKSWNTSLSLSIKLHLPCYLTYSPIYQAYIKRQAPTIRTTRSVRAEEAAARHVPGWGRAPTGPVDALARHGRVGASLAVVVRHYLEATRLRVQVEKGVVSVAVAVVIYADVPGYTWKYFTYILLRMREESWWWSKWNASFAILLRGHCIDYAPTQYV